MIDIETLYASLKPIGTEFHIFLIDYTDKRGNDYNTNLTTINHGSSDKEVIAEIKHKLHGQGFKVTSIHEILDIQAYKRLQSQYNGIDGDTLPQITATEFLKFFRPLYYNT